MNTISDEKLLYWASKYQLKNLVISGYQGGYPIIEFQKEERMPVIHMSEREIKKVIRSAETYGGIELGVAYNLRQTAFLIVNNETIVICGHEYVLDRILENLF